MPHSLIADLASEVVIQSGAVVSKVIHRGDGMNVTVFGFDSGEELTEHRAGRAAVVQVVSGGLRFTVDGEQLELRPWVMAPDGSRHTPRLDRQRADRDAVDTCRFLTSWRGGQPSGRFAQMAVYATARRASGGSATRGRLSATRTSPPSRDRSLPAAHARPARPSRRRDAAARPNPVCGRMMPAPCSATLRSTLPLTG